MGPTHLDGELFGQNRPDGVTQAGQEAAGSTQRRLVPSGFLPTSQIEKPAGTDRRVGRTRRREFGFPKQVSEKGNCDFRSLGITFFPIFSRWF